MLNDALIALIAFIPGTLAWWRGRRLARLVNDPALPELLMAGQHRLLVVFASALAVMIVLGGARALWGIPLLMLINSAGRYPLRRSLLGESAGIPSYLWRASKSALGGWGFWFFMLITPVIVLEMDARWWPGLLAWTAVLLVWEHTYLRFWLWLHEATPLSDSALAPRIEAIVERAGIRAPELYRIGAAGTRFVNALALPSTTRPAIALGNGLLELLEPDEVAAIYAHELSHIEQFSPRVLRRYQLVNRLLIVLAVIIPLAASTFAPTLAHWLILLWPVLMLSALLMRARKSQLRETESDLRAAALCGDAETVARALIKLHVHAFIPRRWPIDMEREASHPSLARRIQALRGKGEQAIATVSEPTVLQTAREGSAVVFEQARAWWFDGVPDGTARDIESLRKHAASVRSVAWQELVELRVTVKGDDRALRAVHRNGDSWSVPLDRSHVADTQRALDTVDIRLQKELGKRTVPTSPLIAAALLLTTMMSGQALMLLVPLLLVLFRPSTAALAALGAMALGSAVLAAALGQPSGWLDRPELGLAAVAGLGILALMMTWRQVRSRGKCDGVRLTLVVLGAAASFVLLLIAVAALSLPTAQLLELPLIPALTLTLLGVGSVLMISQSRGARRWGIAAAAAALLMTSPVIITAGTLDGDSELALTNAHAVEIGRITLPQYGSELRLSPDGSRFLVRQFDPEMRASSSAARPARYIVSRVNGEPREILAAAVEFLDDERVLVLRGVGETYELRLEQVSSDSVLWTAPLPELYQPKLVVTAGQMSWGVTGAEVGTDSLLVITGNAASPETRFHRFEFWESESVMDYMILDDGERLIVPAFDPQPRLQGLALPLMMIAAYTPAVDLVEITREQRRKVGEIHGFPQCGQPVDQRALCIVRNRNQVQIWEVQSSGKARKIRRLSSDAIIGTAGPGVRLTLTNGTDRITDLDLSARTLTEVQLPPGSGAVYEARSAADRLAVLHRNEDGTQVVFFRTELR
jgi:Zn-dependent protease with chaperone function